MEHVKNFVLVCLFFFSRRIEEKKRNIITRKNRKNRKHTPQPFPIILHEKQRGVTPKKTVNL